MLISYSDPIVFVALWDKEYGVKLVDHLPKSINYDLEQISMQIFFAYQNFFYKEEEETIERTHFQIPIKNIVRKAKVLVDTIDVSDAEKKSSYIVVILFPDYASDSILNKFNDMIDVIGNEFLNSQTVSLLKHYEKISELFYLELQVQDTELVIDDDYSLQDSLLDFKKGIELFSKQNFEQAYYLLKRALVMFKRERNLKLILESTFFMGTILSQLNKFQAAKDYYKELETLAKELDHVKYIETSIFMQGFCSYRNEDYDDALTIFMRLESLKSDLNFINKFKFYSIYGRVLRLKGYYENAMDLLQKAIDFNNQLEQTDEIKEQKAKILLEIGHVQYNIAINIIKRDYFIPNAIDEALNQSLSYYGDAVDVWEEINNYSSLIYTYKLIGNIHDLLNEIDLSIGSYNKALKYAEESNDVMNRLEIFSTIVEQYGKLGEHDTLIKVLDENLSKIRAYAFLDLKTISSYHKKLGESFIIMDRKQEALSELLIALNIYNRFETPIKDALSTLQLIIDVYKDNNEEKYLKYYQEQYRILDEKIQDLERKKADSLKFRVLDVLKEFWIYMIDGKELFSMVSESNFDPQLFGGFISALQALSGELSAQELKSVAMGRSKFTIFREKELPFFIIGRTGSNIDIDLLEFVFTAISREFWKLFQPFLEDFDDDTSRFTNFSTFIEKMTEKDLV